MITRFPLGYSFKLSNGSVVEFEYRDLNQKATSSDDLNELLIKQISHYRKLNMDGDNRDNLFVNQTLPDANIVFNSLSPKGLSVGIQPNTIDNWIFHRPNGLSAIIETRPNLGYKKVCTENFISVANLISNQFLMKVLNKTTRSQVPLISSVVSPYSTFMEILNTKINYYFNLVSMLLFPLCISAGFPMMVFALLIEKEEKIKHFLEVNGLKTWDYWLVVIFYYLIFLNFCVVCFLLFGWMFVNAPILKDTGKIVLLAVLVAWNVAQIGFGVFYCSFWKKTNRAACKNKKKIRQEIDVFERFLWFFRILTLISLRLFVHSPFDGSDEHSKPVQVWISGAASDGLLCLSTRDFRSPELSTDQQLHAGPMPDFAVRDGTRDDFMLFRADYHRNRLLCARSCLQ